MKNAPIIIKAFFLKIKLVSSYDATLNPVLNGRTEGPVSYLFNNVNRIYKYIDYKVPNKIINNMKKLQNILA